MGNTPPRIHRRDEHERARQRDFAGAARNRHVPVLERLAQDLEGGAFELRQLVEKQHAVMRERDFARTRNRAASEQRDIRYRVVRRAKRPRLPIHLPRDRFAGGGVDAEDLEMLFERRRGHDRREAFGDHRFSRAGRPDHEQIVRAGDGDFDRAAQRLLALDFRKIRGAVARGRLRATPRHRGIERRELRFVAQKTHRAIERVDTVDGQLLDHRGFLGGQRRQQCTALAERACEPRHRERAADRPRRTRQAQLACDHPVAEILGFELARRGENPERDWQIIERAFLADVARREIDRGARARRMESAVVERRKNAIAGFLHRGIGQSDEVPPRLASFAGVDLDVNNFGLDSLQSGGRDRREHADEEILNRHAWASANRMKRSCASKRRVRG